MTIRNIHWQAYRLPFLSSFRTGHGTISARLGAILEIKTEQGITGWGEVAPLVEFGTAPLAEALTRLPDLVASLPGKTLEEGLQVLSDLGAAYSAPLLGGVEMALLDALGKIRGCAVGNLLASAGQVRARIPINAVVSAGSTKDAVASAREAIAAGFGCVKLKVGLSPSWAIEIERVAAVREAIGSNVHLRLDANEAWDLEQAITVLTACEKYTIQYIEQPLPATDLSGMRALRGRVSVPIAADEALHGLECARYVLESGAADILIIKPAVVGGLRISRRIIHEAGERGAHCVITGAIESGIGLAATLHLAAASPEVTMECGLGTGYLLADDFILEALTIQGGYIQVPDGFGLGIELDRDALDTYCLAVG